MSGGDRLWRLGVLLPFGEPAAITQIPAFAEASEAVGVDGIWTFDMIGRRKAHAEPLTALAAAAARTTNVELGTSILQLPLRAPAQLAQQVLTVQALAGDRVRLGVGAGSTRGDFEVTALEFEQRFRLLGERLEQLQALYDGLGRAHSSLPGWPRTALPPVFIGSWAGGHWIERAASHWSGWIASAAKTTRQSLADGVVRFRELDGARALVTNVHLDLTAPASDQGDDHPFDLRAPLATVLDRLQWLVGLGYETVIVDTGGRGLTDVATIIDAVGPRITTDPTRDGRSCYAH